MEQVLEYLEQKNEYYEKFLTVTMKFRDQINQNNWEDLEFFVDNRERILNIIRSFDFQILKATENNSISTNDEAEYKNKVKSLMDRRSELAAKIVALDLEVIARIDEYKSDTIRELKKTVETQNQVNSFVRTSPRKAIKSA